MKILNVLSYLSIRAAASSDVVQGKAGDEVFLDCTQQ